MSQPTYLLAIDCGTQSARALLFDTKGELIAKGQQALQPYVSPQPGWAEQEVGYYWQAVSAACQQLWQRLQAKNIGFDKRQILAVSMTSQRTTSVILDVTGKPLRPAIVWLDQRRAKLEGEVPGIWRWLFKLAGAEDLANRYREKCAALWIAQQQPELWRQTDKYLLLSGYLSYRLTGRFVDSSACQVGYIPFDFKRQQWAKASDWRYRILPDLQQKLPELVKPGEPLGSITAEAAADTGLPQGLPVIAAAADKACEILGSGGTSPEIACMSYGTTATINTANRRFVEPIRHLPAYPAAIPGVYNSEIMIFRGFWMVSWFKQEFGLREQHIAEQRGIQPEQLFDELVNAVPAGSMGLMLQPYWAPGVRDPGPEAKGGIIGFGDVHTRAHLYRAILEGLAYSLKEGLQKLEKRNRVKVHTIRVSGGGSQSDAAMQLTADIFNLPAERPHTYETSGLGAAIDAAVGMGVYKDFDQAIVNMTRVGDIFQPDPQRAKLYAQLYNDVYLKMYRQLQPLYKRIQQITGYPA